ncbi:hypothetical protein RvY_08204 [Ramazzottius varieornatus]|uniref:Uncharacterized protein n=1 Tax=Ramazzottius varieornatus TaxID=947166 RepID=A0A1D1V4Z7_RAMVA|nr:hypothetical protein RvY_08204 [Ramazzottius varieornatus]
MPTGLQMLQDATRSGSLSPPQWLRCIYPPSLYCTGYYVDYVSCYYVPTHDPYFEYYDSLNQLIVYCAQGYVMTGISKKISRFTGEWFFD